jgi:hypothetical protein
MDAAAPSFAAVFVLLVGLGILLFSMFLLVWSLVWVCRDANERGKPGWLVALLCFLFSWPMSLVMWLVFRPELPTVLPAKGTRAIPQ